MQDWTIEIKLLEKNSQILHHLEGFLYISDEDSVNNKTEKDI